MPGQSWIGLVKAEENRVQNAKTKTWIKTFYRNLDSIPAKIGLSRKINSKQGSSYELKNLLQLSIIKRNMKIQSNKQQMQEITACEQEYSNSGFAIMIKQK